MISCTTSCRRVLVAVLNERGSPADVIGLSSNNLVPFSPNVVLSTRIFSANPVPKKRMFSVPAIYVLGPLQVCWSGTAVLLSQVPDRPKHPECEENQRRAPARLKTCRTAVLGAR